MSSQEVIDFVSCRLKDKDVNRIPTQQDLSLICESVSAYQLTLICEFVNACVPSTRLLPLCKEMVQ